MNPPTMTPESTIITFDRRCMSFGIFTVTNTVIKPPTNAKICVCQVFMYSRIDRAAPTHAPYDTPRMSGETSGFWNTP